MLGSTADTCLRQLTRSCRTRVLTCPLLCWTVWSRQFLARLWMCLSLCNDSEWSDRADSRASAAVAVIAGRRHPSHGAEADSHGFPCSEDHGDSPHYFSWWSMSLFCTCRLLLLSVVRQSRSHSAARRHPYRGADADSHGPFHHRFSPAAVH